MVRNRLIAAAALVAALGLAVSILGSIALAEPNKEVSSDFKLPPGWTEADLKACMAAGTPGKMHEMLNKDAGIWEGKSTMWMGPDTQPINSTCTSTFTTMMDGRYVKCEMNGEMPGMGPYNGLGIYGFDNVSQKFVATWIDNHSTGMMTGTGDLSADGKTITWNYTFNCPLNGKESTLREIDKDTSATTKTLDMFTTDPKSGKEYKMMHIDFTKK